MHEDVDRENGTLIGMLRTRGEHQAQPEARPAAKARTRENPLTILGHDVGNHRLATTMKIANSE